MEDDQLIKNVQAGKSRPAKSEELVSFIKRALERIEEIKLYYKKLHEGTDEEESIVTQIEKALDQIKRAHKELFNPDEKGEIKTQQLNQKIEEIKQYHKQLLEGDDSIKADIGDSQTHITEFYKFLFETEEGQEKDNETKTKEAIEKITNFNSKLTDEIENEVERIYKLMTEKYTDLFEASEGETSKIEQLNKNISRIQAFDENLDKKVKPNIESKQKYLDELKIDMDKKRKDVNSLLGNITGGALAQGYRESMEEYSQKGSLSYKKALDEAKTIPRIYKCIRTFFHNNLGRHVGITLNYLIFFLPLVAICLIFIEPEFVKELLNLTANDQVTFTGSEYIFFKASVSLPLLWIAWYGQKNISQRKRLFEEYNHKLRVVQMYIMFTANGNTYNLAQKNELEGTLLAAINSNPAEHLGKGETMVDSILEKFYIGGFYKKLKKEMLSEINPIKTDDK